MSIFFKHNDFNCFHCSVQEDNQFSLIINSNLVNQISNDIDLNSIAETSNCDLELKYHHYSSLIYDSSLLNQQSEFNNRIKNTIKMKHNLAKIDLLKILHNLKCPISARLCFILMVLLILLLNSVCQLRRLESYIGEL